MCEIIQRHVTRSRPITLRHNCDVCSLQLVHNVQSNIQGALGNSAQSVVNETSSSPEICMTENCNHTE